MSILMTDEIAELKKKLVEKDREIEKLKSENKTHIENLFANNQEIGKLKDEIDMYKTFLVILEKVAMRCD